MKEIAARQTTAEEYVYSDVVKRLGCSAEAMPPSSFSDGAVQFGGKKTERIMNMQKHSGFRNDACNSKPAGTDAGR